MLMNISNKKNENNKYSIVLILSAILLGLLCIYLIISYIIGLKINPFRIITIFVTLEAFLINFIDNLNIAKISGAYINIRGLITCWKGKWVKLFMPFIDFNCTKFIQLPIKKSCSSIKIIIIVTAFFIGNIPDILVKPIYKINFPTVDLSYQFENLQVLSFNSSYSNNEARKMCYNGYAWIYQTQFRNNIDNLEKITGIIKYVFLQENNRLFLTEFNFKYAIIPTGGSKAIYITKLDENNILKNDKYWVHRFQEYGIQDNCDKLLDKLRGIKFIPTIDKTTGNFIEVPGCRKLVRTSPENLNNTYNSLVILVKNMSQSIYNMAQHELIINNIRWDGSDVERDSKKAIQSLADVVNNFSDKAAMVKHCNDGRLNMSKFVDRVQTEGTTSKTIRNIEDLKLTDADLIRNRRLDIVD
jgi:hypothetical protein